MTLDETVVIFRVWRAGPKSVLGLFPFERANDSGHVMSYEHVGQHGGADYQTCILATRPAKPEEYADLQRELEGIGYHLVIRTRRIGRMAEVQE